MKLYSKLTIFSIFLFTVLILISYQVFTKIFSPQRVHDINPYFGDCITTMVVNSSTIDNTYKNKLNELGSDHFLVSDGFFMDIQKLRNYTFNNNKLCVNVLFDFLEVDFSKMQQDKFAMLYQEKLKYIQKTEGFPFKRFKKGEFSCAIFDDGRKLC